VAGTNRDYYEILGVARDADAKNIKSAYRRLAHKLHPDKNPDDKEAAIHFREITEAYEVLSDDNKRRYYDRFGRDGAQSAGFGFSGAAGAGSVGDIFSDIFSDIFGGKTKTRSKETGRDLRYSLDLSFEEAALGCDREIVIPRWRACATCTGSGAAPGTSPQYCQACGGTGEVRVQQGFFSVAKTCGYCRGRGRVISEPCKTCGGAGRERVESPFLVHVPAGADENTILKFSGEGEPSTSGGTPGDLRIVLNIKPHPLFTREAENVTCRVPISFVQATLGATLEVPTMDGRVRMKVPPGTQSGRVFRLRGKGMPTPEGRGRGDQLVTVNVEVPHELSDKQKHLLREFDTLMSKESEPEQKGFWDKVKELFS
jgi:molecular chaperone DnaJ